MPTRRPAWTGMHQRAVAPAVVVGRRRTVRPFPTFLHWHDECLPPVTTGGRMQRGLGFWLLIAACTAVALLLCSGCLPFGAGPGALAFAGLGPLIALVVCPAVLLWVFFRG